MRDDHRLRHHRRAGGRAGDQPSGVENLADSRVDRSVADLAGDLELVTAGEEDRIGISENSNGGIVARLFTTLDIEMVNVTHSQSAQAPLVLVEHLVRRVGRDGGDDELPGLPDFFREHAQDDLLAILVLVAADDEKAAEPWSLAHTGLLWKKRAARSVLVRTLCEREAEREGRSLPGLAGDGE
jgi:hypothetical protein